MVKRFAEEVEDIADVVPPIIKHTYSVQAPKYNTDQERRAGKFIINGGLGAPTIQIPDASKTDLQIESTHKFVFKQLARPDKLAIYFCPKQRAHWWSCLKDEGDPFSHFRIGPFWYKHDLWTDICDNFNVEKNDLHRIS